MVARVLSIGHEARSLNRPFRQPAALKRTLEPHPRGGADGKRRAQVRRARIDRQFA